MPSSWLEDEYELASEKQSLEHYGEHTETRIEATKSLLLPSTFAEPGSEVAPEADPSYDQLKPKLQQRYDSPEPLSESQRPAQVENQSVQPPNYKPASSETPFLQSSNRTNRDSIDYLFEDSDKGAEAPTLSRSEALRKGVLSTAGASQCNDIKPPPVVQMCQSSRTPPSAIPGLFVYESMEQSGLASSSLDDSMFENSILQLTESGPSTDQTVAKRQKLRCQCSGDCCGELNGSCPPSDGACSRYDRPACTQKPDVQKGETRIPSQSFPNQDSLGFPQARCVGASSEAATGLLHNTDRENQTTDAPQVEYEACSELSTTPRWNGTIRDNKPCSCLQSGECMCEPHLCRCWHGLQSLPDERPPLSPRYWSSSSTHKLQSPLTCISQTHPLHATQDLPSTIIPNSSVMLTLDANPHAKYTARAVSQDLQEQSARPPTTSSANPETPYTTLSAMHRRFRETAPGMLPTNNAVAHQAPSLPPTRPDTPRPTGESTPSTPYAAEVIQEYVRQSVEPESPPRGWTMLSTPGYIDRSETPSPISRVDADVKMSDLSENTPRGHATREQSMPLSSPEPEARKNRPFSATDRPLELPLPPPPPLVLKQPKRGDRRKSAVQGAKVDKRVVTTGAKSKSRRATAARQPTASVGKLVEKARKLDQSSAEAEDQHPDLRATPEARVEGKVLTVVKKIEKQIKKQQEDREKTPGQKQKDGTPVRRSGRANKGVRDFS